MTGKSGGNARASSTPADTSPHFAPAIHFANFDGMRGILAVLVMLYHYGLSSLVLRATHGLVREVDFGLCVDFFFVLSGFVLAHSYSATPMPPGAFFARRFLRLAPTSFVATLLFVPLSPRSTEPITLAANLALLDDIGPFRVIVPPSWSVPYELYLPLIGLLIAPWLRRIGPKTIVTLAAAAILIGTLAIVPASDGKRWHLLRAAGGLTSGALLYRARPHLRVQLPDWLGPTAFLIAIAAMTLAQVSVLLRLAFYPCVALAILGGVRPGRWLSSPPARFLGDVSFPLYLVHVPVMDFALLVFGRNGSTGSFLAKGAWVIASVALAWAIHRWVEAPCNEWGRRRFGRRAEAPPELHARPTE